MCVDRHDVGLLMLRLGTGAVLCAHGAQKLFGWFDGPGMTGAAEMMESVSYLPGRPSAMASAAAEAGGGVLLAMGLATPAAGAAAAGGMAGAAAVHAPHGFFAQNGGLEYPAFLGMVAASIAVMGPGRLSLDHVMGHTLNRSWMVPSALAAVAAAATVVIGARQRRIQAAQADTDNAD
ncbi:DoxX family protein [Streptomyces odontomachi]|uniref:DoxX family protein n=1 Tax=Streptomyces odontomachi TaxID=2944940 RepID=UPI0021098213|nr:DoxX family protein [Streptomyces sp. ODS25]